jgi:hypothetical protein
MTCSCFIDAVFKGLFLDGLHSGTAETLHRAVKIALGVLQVMAACPAAVLLLTSRSSKELVEEVGVTLRGLRGLEQGDALRLCQQLLGSSVKELDMLAVVEACCRVPLSISLACNAITQGGVTISVCSSVLNNALRFSSVHVISYVNATNKKLQQPLALLTFGTAFTFI